MLRKQSKRAREKKAKSKKEEKGSGKERGPKHKGDIKSPPLSRISKILN